MGSVQQTNQGFSFDRAIAQFSQGNKDSIAEYFELLARVEHAGPIDQLQRICNFDDEIETLLVTDVMEQYAIEDSLRFKPLTKFPQFSRLPFDARYMIWTLAMSSDSPRVVEIFKKTWDVNWNTNRPFEKSEAAAVRLACKEADIFFRQNYFIGLSNSKQNPEQNAALSESIRRIFYTPSVAFRPNKDIVYLNCACSYISNLSAGFNFDHLTHIELLAINVPRFAVSDYAPFVLITSTDSRTSRSCT